MNPYQALKDQHQAEVNNFPIKCAFTKDRLKEIMREWSLPEDDFSTLAEVGPSSFIRKSDLPEWRNLIQRHNKELNDKILADKNGTEFVYQMFMYELGNHEWIITYDLHDALAALNLTEDKVYANPTLLKGLKRAMNDIESWHLSH